MKSQGQGHSGLKCAKMANFRGSLLHWYVCIQKTNWWITVLQNNI